VLGGRYAEERLRRPAHRFRFRARALAAAHAVRESGGSRALETPLRVLDLGCAEGSTLLELGRLLPVAEGVGVEASTELIEAALPLPEGVRLVSGDVTDLRAVLGPEPFDLVTALAVLEHLPRPALAVREAARVLRPGGLFVATCPEPAWDAVSTRLGLLDEGQHESDMRRARLEAAVLDAGLELISYRRFMLAPTGALPYLRVPLSPALSWTIDRAVGAVRLFDWLFVNQRVVGRRPA
jgi:SAM-dependent methyltransferase